MHPLSHQKSAQSTPNRRLAGARQLQA